MNWYKKAENTEEKSQMISCPFCGETDFDMIGLKRHLESGQCVIFNEVDVDPVRKLMDNF